MSNIVTNFCRPMTLRPTPKCVLMALADRADDSGVAWPSIDWLCEWTCFSRRAVMNALDELSEAGLILLAKSAGKNTRYAIVLEKMDGDQGQSCTPTRAGGARVDEDQNADDPCTTCTRAADAPVQEVHTHPCTTCTPTRAGGAHGGAGGAPDTSIDINKTSKQTTSARAKVHSADLPEGFAEFWELYPKKTAKVTAAKSWRSKRLDGDDDLRVKVMAALAVHRELPSWKKDGGQYIPNPATWLNQERWNDEVGRAAAANLDRWWLAAGFPNVHEAENAGCWQHNVAKFRDGKRLQVAVEDMA